MPALFGETKDEKNTRHSQGEEEHHHLRERRRTASEGRDGKRARQRRPDAPNKEGKTTPPPMGEGPDGYNTLLPFPTKRRNRKEKNDRVNHHQNKGGLKLTIRPATLQQQNKSGECLTTQREGGPDAENLLLLVEERERTHQGRGNNTKTQGRDGRPRAKGEEVRLHITVLQFFVKKGEDGTT